MRISSIILCCIALFPALQSVVGAESEPVQKPGIKTLQLVSDSNSIEPGKAFSIGLFIQHLPEYHTYWKAPGIVGVPTTINWEMPEGFAASDIEWPVPELTKMAQYTAYGYERDTCLLTRISVPEKLDVEEVTLRARVAFMCCAKTCHPGWHDFEITLPVNREGRPDFDRNWQKVFASSRQQRAEDSPETWGIQAKETELEIKVTLNTESKEFRESEDWYCFCEDNQINSDLPQTVELSEDGKQITFTLIKSGFGPENLKKFSGLLYHPDGWPGTSSKWVRISAPLSSS